MTVRTPCGFRWPRHSCTVLVPHFEHRCTCGEVRPNIDEEKVRADVEEGLVQSASSDVVSLGSFEQYADEDV